METYNNDYTKEEDNMMWELHEIRKKIARDGINFKKINKDGEDFLRKNNLTNLKIVKTKKPIGLFKKPK